MKIIILLSSLLLCSCLAFKPSRAVSALSIPDEFRLYPAYVVNVYDGDTLTAEIDMGFNLKLTDSIRLYGIDAPEIRGDSRLDGLTSRDGLKSLVDESNIIIMVPKKEKDKYKR